MLRRLCLESVFAAFAALSFIQAYTFWVELATRPASPSSLLPLYGPGIAFVLFLWGACDILVSSSDTPVSGRRLQVLFVGGLLLMLWALLSSQLWR